MFYETSCLFVYIKYAMSKIHIKLYEMKIHVISDS